MLTLGRKISEKLILRINGDIIAKITLVDSSNRQAKIGIEAGKEIEIIRGELLDTWRGRCQDT